MNLLRIWWCSVTTGHEFRYVGTKNRLHSRCRRCPARRG